MKTISLSKRVICVLLTVFMAVTLFTYTFWDSYYGSERKTVDIGIGRYPGDYSDNPLENMPDFVPPSIVAILEELDEIKDREIMAAIIDKVINIYYQDLTHVLHLGATAEDIFAPDRPSLQGGDYLIYTTGSGDDMEIVIVHIEENSNHIPTNADALSYMLENSWTGVNEVSIMWRSGSLYSSFHAPIEYAGKLYMNMNDGDRYTPPAYAAGGTWFLVTPDLEYSSYNSAYPRGYITKSNGRYFIAVTSVWGVVPSTADTWAWREVNEWSGSTASDTVVYTVDSGTVRFWQAMTSTSAEPSEANARSGLWREVKNAWIGRRGDMTVKNFYLEYNRYTTGDVVVFGISPNMRYRYFQAKGDVPHDEPPLKESGSGTLVLNDYYWTEWQ